MRRRAGGWFGPDTSNGLFRVNWAEPHAVTWLGAAATFFVGCHPARKRRISDYFLVQERAGNPETVRDPSLTLRIPAQRPARGRWRSGTGARAPIFPSPKTGAMPSSASSSGSIQSASNSQEAAWRRGAFRPGAKAERAAPRASMYRANVSEVTLFHQPATSRSAFTDTDGDLFSRVCADGSRGASCHFDSTPRLVRLRYRRHEARLRNRN